MTDTAASVLSILHVTAPGEVGGLETVLRSLASGHHELGHRVGVVAVVDPVEGTHPFVASLEEMGIQAFQVEIHRRGYLGEIRRVGEIIRSFRPDVLHTHGSRADLLHFPTAKRAGVPIVTTLHGSSRPRGLAGFSERLQLVLLRWFDGVVAVSAPLARELEARGVSHDRIHFIPNAVGASADPLPAAEARRELGLGGVEGPVLGWVGRLIPLKGADVFLQALAQVADLPWTASIIGHGPEHDALTALSRDVGIEGRVRFHGTVADASRYQSAFDTFVLSSRSEGIPMVLFEAAVAGTPIIATRVGGVPDVFSEEEALLVDSEDPRGLAAAIREVLQDPAAAQGRSQRARSRVASEFSFATWMRRHETLYRSLAATR